MRTITHIKPGTALTVAYIDTGDTAQRVVKVTGPMPKDGLVADALAAMTAFVPELYGLTPFLAWGKRAELGTSLSLNSVTFTEHPKKGTGCVVSAKIAGARTNGPANLNTPVYFPGAEGAWEESFEKAQAVLMEAIDEWIDTLPPEGRQLSLDDGADMPGNERDDTQEARTDPDGGVGTHSEPIVDPGSDLEPAEDDDEVVVSPGDFTCGGCGDSFDTRALLDDHYAKEHPNVAVGAG